MTPIFEPLKSKLCELYENEGIFEKFNISVSPCGNYWLSGLFNHNFHISDKEGDFNYQYQLSYEQKTIFNHIPKKFYEPIVSNYEYDKKVSHSAWHPKDKTVCIAMQNCIFFYGQEKS